jgi:aconitate decarboxylase
MTLDVVVELADGRVVTGRCDGPPGIWGKPVDPPRLAAKARDCLTTAFGEARTEHIMADAARFGDLPADGVLEFLSGLSSRPAHG